MDRFEKELKINGFNLVNNINRDKYTMSETNNRKNDKGVHRSPGLHLLVQLPMLGLFH